MFDKLGAVETKLPHHMRKHAVNFCLKSRSFTYLVLYCIDLSDLAGGQRCSRDSWREAHSLAQPLWAQVSDPRAPQRLCPQEGCDCRALVPCSESYRVACSRCFIPSSSYKWRRGGPGGPSEMIWRISLMEEQGPLLASFSHCWLCSHLCLLFFRRTESCRDY